MFGFFQRENVIYFFSMNNLASIATIIGGIAILVRLALWLFKKEEALTMNNPAKFLKPKISLRYRRVADNYYNIGKFDSAIELYEKALANHNSKSSHNLGLLHGMLGYLYNVSSIPEKALDHLLRAESVFSTLHQIKSKLMLGYIYGFISTVLYFQKDYDKSLEYAVKSKELADKYMRNNEFAMLINAQAVFNEADIYLMNNRADYAKKLVEDILPTVKNNNILLPEVYRHLSSIHEALGNEYEHNDYKSKMLNIFTKRDISTKKIYEIPGMPTVELAEAVRLYDANNYEGALILFEDCIKKIGYNNSNHLLIGHIQLTMAEINRRKNNHVKALSLYESASNIFDELRISDLTVKSEIYQGKAEVYLSLSEYDKALKYFTDILNIAFVKKDTVKVANCYDRLGWTNFLMGNYDDAEKCYKEHLSLHRINNISKNAEVADGYDGIAYVHFAQKDFEKAHENFSAAFEMRKKVGSKAGIAVSMHNIASVYRERGEFQLAEELLNEALRINKKLPAEHHSNMVGNYVGLAKISLKASRYNDAMAHLDTALRLNKMPEDSYITAYITGVQGEAYEGLNFDEKAVVHYKSALDIMERRLGKNHPETKELVKKISRLNTKKLLT